MLLLPPNTTFLSVALMDEKRKNTPGAISRTSLNFIAGGSWAGTAETIQPHANATASHREAVCITQQLRSRRNSNPSQRIINLCNHQSGCNEENQLIGF